ncbi:prepilin peptidase [Tissierella simiarum]|nr:A24 family peptidase [Tissierella simiarum]
MQVKSILQGVLFSFLLMVASYTDIKKREIPDTICIFIALIGLLRFSFLNLFGIIIAIPFLLGAVLKENSIGGGDIKVTASAGIVLGFWRGIYGLIIGLSLLVLFYLFLVLISEIKKKQVARNLPMPLAPFLGLGFMIIYFMN